MIFFKIVVSAIAACVFTTFAIIPAKALMMFYGIDVEPETLMYSLLIGSFVVAMLMNHENIVK